MARVEGFEPAKSGQEPVGLEGNPVPVGVWGDSDSGVGVFGTSGALPPGVDNIPANIAGVEGHSIQHPGVFGRSVEDAGVFGESIQSQGMVGRSETFSGVLGVTFTPSIPDQPPAGHGVFGVSTAGGNGVVGFVGNATGVIGNSVKGIGVRGTSGGNTIGVFGQSASGTGVFGQGDSGTGVIGESVSSAGVFGTSSSRDGVVGASTSGNGVYGFSPSGFGVAGASISANGVRGVSNQHDGVVGVSFDADHAGVAGSNGSSGGYGIYGESAGGYAGYFQGDVGVNGTLFKAGGSFKIDHPLDPGNKYLCHSFVESPDMLNVYNGNVTTDAKGEASVTLPDYFEALNQGFRYQLTVIGQFAQAIVAQEIRNNQLTIKTDQPQIKVSWQVTGIRQDPWAVANRIVVEEEKAAEEKGKYLHPKLWGQPEESMVHRRPRGSVVEARQLSELPPLEKPQRIDRARLEEEWRQVEELVQRMR
jgi:hypothetical protein